MSITSALMLFFVLAFVYILIIEVFTVLFRLTGLTADKAHFQVISMLTNCGFTTLDSEAIVTSRIRRRIAQVTIIFGYLTTVVFMSSVVNIFLSLSRSEIADMGPSIVVVCISILLIMLITHSSFVKKNVDRAIASVGRKIMFGKDVNAIVVLDVFEDNVMAEINLSTLPLEMKNIMLMDSGLKETYKIQLILIKRDGETMSIIKGTDILQKDDIIVVFGSLKNIKLLFGQDNRILK